MSHFQKSHRIKVSDISYVAAASTLDGHDSFYENNPQKGNRVGIGILGGYSGGQGPGKDNHLVYPVGGLSGGGGSFGGEGGREHRAHRVKYMVVEDWIF